MSWTARSVVEYARDTVDPTSVSSALRRSPAENHSAVDATGGGGVDPRTLTLPEPVDAEAIRTHGETDRRVVAGGQQCGQRRSVERDATRASRGTGNDQSVGREPVVGGRDRHGVGLVTDTDLPRTKLDRHDVVMVQPARQFVEAVERHERPAIRRLDLGHGDRPVRQPVAVGGGRCDRATAQVEQDAPQRDLVVRGSTRNLPQGGGELGAVDRHRDVLGSPLSLECGDDLVDDRVCLSGVARRSLGEPAQDCRCALGRTSQHQAHRLHWNADVAHPPDQGSPAFELRRVVAVAGARIHLRRWKQAGLVVVAKRARREVDRPCEGADRQQRFGGHTSES